MKNVSVTVQKEFCEECSLALRRFIGKMDGVDSIEVGEGKIVISFDGSRISEEDILKITKESIEKLGYTMNGQP
ncbi:MAG TPA: heavy metal-associated domain-containing protein [Thermodesulfovibrionales bacterium]|nr:heavy metal-associated domain-containing protein [Thermodesulfovibrionales bacterium]